MAAPFPNQQTCQSCGQAVPADALICPLCGGFTHRADLERLSTDATRLELTNPRQAAAIWHQVLTFLPPDSQQFATIRQRLADLHVDHGRIPSHSRTLAKNIAITIGSMLLSMFIYYYVEHSWAFAIGIVLLILVHEMGHVVANLFLGVPQSPPIFIPFLGAVIMLRGQLANAKVEAISAIAGPIAGALGTVPVFLWYLKTGDLVALELTQLGIFINLFNLLPVPPLDGGRVAAAMSPRIWIIGLIAMGWIMLDDFRHGRDVSLLIFIAIFALPRIIQTLKGGRHGAYYQIGRRASMTIATCYLALLFVLAGSYFGANHIIDRIRSADVQQ
jgi:Zn-dependent protease